MIHWKQINKHCWHLADPKTGRATATVYRHGQTRNDDGRWRAKRVEWVRTKSSTQHSTGRTYLVQHIATDLPGDWPTHRQAREAVERMMA